MDRAAQEVPEIDRAREDRAVWIRASGRYHGQGVRVRSKTKGEAMSLKVFHRSRRRIRAALREHVLQEFNSRNYAMLACVRLYQPRRFAVEGFLIKRMVEVHA
jgi:hypothetical protein